MQHIGNLQKTDIIVANVQKTKLNQTIEKLNIGLILFLQLTNSKLESSFLNLTMTTLKIGLANLTVILPASSLCSLQLRSNKQTNKQNTKKTSKQRKAKYKAENTQ